MTNPAGLVAMVPSENDAANWRRWPAGFPPQKPHFSSGTVFRFYVIRCQKKNLPFLHNYILNLLTYLGSSKKSHLIVDC